MTVYSKTLPYMVPSNFGAFLKLNVSMQLQYLQITRIWSVQNSRQAICLLQFELKKYVCYCMCMLLFT